ncbi:MAG TPA: phosphoenolpyruvate synthase [Leucothrix mucor]|uniref:Phosphoenolpyruvate synthase n=1 Tax=Leucothrix mucor TaxID=45248 RepID=A0A7V2T1S6_LEUMU|nr:phosphoenolpyruvate synthase [Leucothrix mucor]
MRKNIIEFNNLSMSDVNEVGGKNASLGEMISHLSTMGISVPNGFATTTHAYHGFLTENKLIERINTALNSLDINNITELSKVGSTIRSWIMSASLQQDLLDDIGAAYQQMLKESGDNLTVAVRSSATAEDLPDASFAGQQETFLNVRGLDAIIAAIKEVFASLYNDRAISYRVHQDFDHSKVLLSAGIQKMVRSDIGASGVMFTLDTESGFRDSIFITGAYGLGETVVQGAVNPDEFNVYKPAIEAGRPAILKRQLGDKAIEMVFSDDFEHDKSCLTRDVDQQRRSQFCINDSQIEELSRQALSIEKHYGYPMDIEWALDGGNQKIYIVQARPETVESQNTGTMIERYELKEHGEKLVEGRAIGQRIGQGIAKVIDSIEQMDKVKEGDVLVTDMTDPDWEPIMKRASAIVTNRGGRTCHAAIIARELGVPAIVGCGNATRVILDGQQVTASCAEGDTGIVYAGELEFKHTKTDTGNLPDLPVKIMMNIGNPSRAFSFAQIPNAGIGLARLEFIINNMIGIHPKALLEYDELPENIKKQVLAKTSAYADPVSFYVEKLVEGISTLAAAFSPKDVIVRLSDFKTNEYANLLAGDLFEPHEENPMIGYRGVSRYLSDEFHECFELECQAIKRVRNEMGLTNLQIMIPFCRTLEEAQQVINLLASNGLKRGEAGLKVMMMCELPSNAVLAEEFLAYFDGFSIGSNDMTQLTLGLDRDSGLIAHLFDERNPAVKKMLEMAISACHKQGKYIGICGQGPSDYPDFAAWLLEQKITSISLNPDTVVDTWLYLSQ